MLNLTPFSLRFEQPALDRLRLFVYTAPGSSEKPREPRRVAPVYSVAAKVSAGSSKSSSAASGEPVIWRYADTHMKHDIGIVKNKPTNSRRIPDIPMSVLRKPSPIVGRTRPEVLRHARPIASVIPVP